MIGGPLDILFGAEIDVAIPAWFWVVLLLVAAVVTGIFAAIVALVWLLTRKRNSD